SSAHPVYKNTPIFFLCHYTDDDGGRAAWHQGIAYLLARGADPNVPSEDSQETPLHQIATAHAAMSTAKCPRDHGANPLVPNTHGVVPYQVAVRNGNAATAQVIAERGGAVPL